MKREKEETVEKKESEDPDSRDLRDHKDRQVLMVLRVIPDASETPANKALPVKLDHEDHLVARVSAQLIAGRR